MSGDYQCAFCQEPVSFVLLVFSCAILNPCIFSADWISSELPSETDEALYCALEMLLIGPLHRTGSLPGY